MVFKLVMSMNSMIFGALLSIISLVILGVSLAFLGKNQRLFEKLNRSMMRSADEIRKLERCDIANLAWIRDTLDDPEFPLLGSAAEQMVEDSERLYQGKWIGDPSKLMTLDNLLTRRQYAALSNELPAQLLAVSLLASGLFWLMGSLLFEKSASVFLPASIPFIMGIVFALLIQLRNNKIRRELERSGQYLADLITRRLPVFEELAGTAVLIDSFVRYDREMSESVAYLSEAIDRLGSNELSDKISENIRVVMQEEIAPSYQQAAQALVDLTVTITERQEAGMHELASEFSKDLSQTLADVLTPLFAEIRHLTERMSAASNDVDLSLDALKEASALQEQLQDRSLAVLEQISEDRGTWNDDLHAMQQSLNKMSELTAQLTELYSGESMQLGSRLEGLSEELRTFSMSIHEVLGGLAQENQRVIKTVNQFDERGAVLLEDLRQLSLELNQQSAALMRQSSQINESLTGLNSNLNESVRQFSLQIQSGVESTLKDFDQGLAEVSLRLANTSGEIRDSLRQNSQLNSLRQPHPGDADDARMPGDGSEHY